MKAASTCTFILALSMPICALSPHLSASENITRYKQIETQFGLKIKIPTTCKVIGSKPNLFSCLDKSSVIALIKAVISDSDLNQLKQLGEERIESLCEQECNETYREFGYTFNASMYNNKVYHGGIEGIELKLIGTSPKFPGERMYCRRFLTSYGKGSYMDFRIDYSSDTTNVVDSVFNSIRK